MLWKDNTCNADLIKQVETGQYAASDCPPMFFSPVADAAQKGIEGSPPQKLYKTYYQTQNNDSEEDNKAFQDKKPSLWETIAKITPNKVEQIKDLKQQIELSNQLHENM